MPGLRIRFFFKLLLLATVLLLSEIASAAEWYKEYEAAIDFIRKGRYGEAIPRLQAAIAQKNQEGLNIKFYGMKFDDYVPHYYLGRAYFQQQNYQAALRELDTSASQGAIQRNAGLFQNLTEMKTLATAQLKLQQPVTPPPLVAEKEPEPVQPKPAPVIPEKKPEAQPAVREQPPAKTEPSSVTRTDTSKPAAPPPAAPVETAEELNLKKAKALTREGARRYFQGDFDAAISSFSAALRLAPDDLSAQYLLGCSYATKYLLSGSSDDQSFKKASAAFQKIRRTNPDYPLTKNPLISPAVREIYQKSGGA